MRTYNSKEPTICISLAEFQKLTQDSKILRRWLAEGDIDYDLYEYAVQRFTLEDMNG